MAALEQFKCPSCGGTVEFNIGSQNMKCPYCDSEFDIEAVKENEEAKANVAEDNINWQETAGQAWDAGETEGLVVYACESCGGEIVGDENLGATSCPYCGSKIVIKDKFAGNLKPDYIIPFKKDKKQAKETFAQFVSSNKYAPKLFKSKAHIDEIQGVYVPFWLFDADVTADITYDATKTHTSRHGDYRTTITNHFSVRRQGTVAFNNVPVDASSEIADDMMESIEPFDFGEAVEFNMSYLAGFTADKYDVDHENSIERANTRIKTSTEKALARSVKGYDSVVPDYTHIDLEGGKVKYALYPVWLLSATYEGQPYTFAMNGQTGKFTGDLPVDKKALRRYYWKCTGVLTAIFLAASMLLF